jgi:hypothetical protein
MDPVVRAIYIYFLRYSGGTNEYTKNNTYSGRNARGYFA